MKRRGKNRGEIVRAKQVYKVYEVDETGIGKFARLQNERKVGRGEE